MDTNKVTKEAKWVVAAVAVGTLLTIGTVVAKVQPVVIHQVKVVTVVVAPTATPSATLVPFRKTTTVVPAKTVTVAPVKK